MSRGRKPATHVGPRPKGTITLEEAARLVGFAGKSTMTVRRRIEAARIGFWQPEGSRAVFAIYDAEAVKGILSPPKRPPPATPAERLPHGRRKDGPPRGKRDGWAPSREILEALEEWSASPRYLRDRLLAIGVPSEIRIVTTFKQHIFPKAQAVEALRSDDLFQMHLHPDHREELRNERDVRRIFPKGSGMPDESE